MKNYAPKLCKRNRNHFRLFSLMCFTLFNIIYSLPLHLNAQSSPESFSEIIDHYIYHEPYFSIEMARGEDNIYNALNNNTQEIMNGNIYTLPIVFHIIHKGEPIGLGSNISQAQIVQTLSDLNNDFRDILSLGNDTKIQFCLAQRDPQGNSQFDASGNNITGIRRVNGTGTSNYENIGISTGVSGNELLVKALSNWPRTDYLNVWVVHDIAGTLTGYATFPFVNDDIDGIVIRSDHAGIASNSHTITQQTGHYFNLYNTFQGSSNFDQCPINSNCNVQGDFICDTRPHSLMNELNNFFPCDESQYLNCDPSAFTYDVSENFMNLTANSCRTQFTYDQVMRMRASLMLHRSTLINSPGCLEECFDVIVDYVPSSLSIEKGQSLNFANTSQFATDYLWEIDDFNTNSFDLSHIFSEIGFFDVCLTAINGDCKNRKCFEIFVYDSSDPCVSESFECDLLKNGNLDEYILSNQSSFISGSMRYFNLFALNICNWKNKQSIASVLAQFQEQSFGQFSAFLFPTGGVAAYVTTDKMLFQKDVTYQINYDILYESIPSPVFGTLTGSVRFGLAPTSDAYIDYSIDQELYTDNVLSKFLVDIPSPSDFETRSFCFTPDEDMLMHFFMEDITSSPVTYDGFITNMSITCKGEICDPQPDFDYDPACPRQFLGFNNGNGGEYTWNFSCNDMEVNGNNVYLDLPPGSCDVCLTITCNLQNSQTICNAILVPDASSACPSICTDLEVLINTCEQDLSEENIFVAEVELTVPDGTTICDDTGLLAGSTLVDVALGSFSSKDNPDDANEDIISIGLTITAAAGVDVLSDPIAGNITLCTPNGDVLCYNISYTGTECDNCEGELTATADCIDFDPDTGVSVYSGTITIDGLSSNSIIQLCQSTSSESSFELFQTNVFNEFDFTFSSDKSGSFQVTSIICIQIFGDPQCYVLTIETTPCGLPTNCIGWANKITTAQNCSVENGEVTYDVVMSGVYLFSNDYVKCEGGLFAGMEGSNGVSLNSGSIFNGSRLSYDVNISMPCNFDTDEIYLLNIYACNDEGEMVCFEFNIEFPDCAQGCDGDNSISITTYADKAEADIGYFYPNPASNRLNIEIENEKDKQHIIEIWDQLGRRVIKKQILSSSSSIDINDLAEGIHIIMLKDDKGTMITTQKLIVLK